MRLSRDRRNVAVLAACQALFASGQSMLIIMSGLVGASLAADKALATLPVSATVTGVLVATIPASLMMKRTGRRLGFIVGAVIGILGGAIAAFALYIQDFWLFTLGTFLAGVQGGFAQFYRFAAADVAAPDFKSKAISLVLAGGVVAAVAGPELVKWTSEMLAPLVFLASYMTIAALPVAAILLLLLLDIPRLTVQETKDPGRPLLRIARQPAFGVAVLSGMVGYGVMSLIMTSTPLAMVACGFVVGDAATVIQWHVLAMFGPSFVTGSLIRRFGVLNIMLIGMGLLAACVAVALAGIDMLNFWIALVALGLGWNFSFVGASTLLTETHKPAERAKVQATNDFLVFGSAATASLLSGAILHLFDWETLQLVAAPFVIAATTALLWLKTRRGRIPAVS